jgi:anti-anti-sigma factor
MPLNGALRHNIGAQLRRGRRTIVLDLSAVATIDAAGIGELVRAYNMTTAAGGVLQISRATRWVREILRRVGLLDILRQG